MNIFLDNVDIGSATGPNHFASKLKKYMQRQGDTFVFDKRFDAQLSFIQSRQTSTAPLFQRLDGIYFNSEQNFAQMNTAIKDTYKRSEGVVFQSEFNKRLTFEYFGEHKNSTIIHNGADLEYINQVRPLRTPVLEQFETVWCCASSWRPHKRLKDNIEYFLQHSNERDCLVVAGSVSKEDMVPHERIFYPGNLEVKDLYSLYKKSKYFIHLAYLDHCPNVVVDAVACGCHVICSSAGGTKEVAIGGTIIEEDEWDLKPTKLYKPPKIDFSRKVTNNYDTNIDMVYVASKYNKFLGESK